MNQPTQNEQLTYYSQYIFHWLGTGISGTLKDIVVFVWKWSIWQPFWCPGQTPKTSTKLSQGEAKWLKNNSPHSSFMKIWEGLDFVFPGSPGRFFRNDHRLGPNLHARLHGSDFLIQVIWWNDICHTSEAIFCIQPLPGGWGRQGFWKIWRLT